MPRYVVWALLVTIGFAGDALAADPQYTAVKMEIDVARPAAAAWARVGGYCDIAKWLETDCVIKSGDGGVGTVRVVLGGMVTEILIAKSDLGYGYTQPVKEGQFYNLYHGFMEAKPVTAQTSKLLYTLVYDNSNLPDQATKDADVARRRTRFEGALKKMKSMAEAP